MPTDPSFRMTIEDVFSIRNRGTVVTGKIETGTVKVGDEVLIQSVNGEKRTTITGVEMFRKTISQAKAGDNVGLLLKNIAKPDVQQGDVLVASGEDFTWKA